MFVRAKGRFNDSLVQCFVFTSSISIVVFVHKIPRIFTFCFLFLYLQTEKQQTNRNKKNKN